MRTNRCAEILVFQKLPPRPGNMWDSKMAGRVTPVHMAVNKIHFSFFIINVFWERTADPHESDDATAIQASTRKGNTNPFMLPSPQISLVNRITPLLPMIQMHRLLFGIINFCPRGGRLRKKNRP
jgi:hypothetical protein